MSALNVAAPKSGNYSKRPSMAAVGIVGILTGSKLSRFPNDDTTHQTTHTPQPTKETEPTMTTQDTPWMICPWCESHVTLKHGAYGVCSAYWEEWDHLRANGHECADMLNAEKEASQ